MGDIRKARLQVKNGSGKEEALIVDYDELMAGRYRLEIHQNSSRSSTKDRWVSTPGPDFQPTDSSVGLEPLLSTYTSVLAEGRLDLIDHFGEDGETVASLVVDTLPFSSVLQSLVEGNLGEATEQLQSGMTTFLRKCLRVAKVFQENSKADVKTETAMQIAQGASEFNQQYREQWATGAQTLLNAVERLSTLRSKTLQPLRERINDFGQSAALISDPDPEFVTASTAVHEAISPLMGYTYWLEDPQGDAPLDRPIAEQTVATLRESVTYYRAMADMVQEDYLAITSEITTHLLDWKAEAEQQLQSLTTATQQINESKKHLGLELAGAAELLGISQKQFTDCEVILSSQEWSPVTARDRLNPLIKGLIQFADSQRTVNKLPDRFDQDATQCLDLIEKIENGWLAATVVRAPVTAPLYSREPSRIEHVLNPLVPPSPSAPVSPPSNASNRSERATELYEQFLCAAHVITNNNLTFAGSTVPALLRVLWHMGRCTDEECTTMISVIEAGIAPEVHLMQGMKGTVQAWQNVAKHWVGFYGNAKGKDRQPVRMLKLTLSGAKSTQVDHLMHKWSIDPTEARAGLAMKKAEDATIHQSVQENRASREVSKKRA